MASQDPALLRRLLRAKDRMDAASEEDWPVERLANVSGVSEAHFARSFKEAFGVPPHRYLLTRRIERAKALLRDTDAPIIEIAFQTGWNSLGTFGRVFRDITGESPSELRAREQASAHQLKQVPHCFVSAAYRPDLTQFRRSGGGRPAIEPIPRKRRSPNDRRYRSSRSLCARPGRGARLLRGQAGLPGPHRRAQWELSLAHGEASEPALVRAWPVPAAGARARRGDGAYHARNDG